MSFAADAAQASAKIKSEVPGKEKEYEKKGEALAAQAGKGLDRTVRHSVRHQLCLLNVFGTRSRMLAESSLRPKLRPRNTRIELAKR